MRRTNWLWLLVVASLAVSCAAASYDNDRRRDDRRSDRRDNRREADSRNGRWELLGERDVEFKNDRDRIDVGRKEGPFRELRIEVREAPIEIREMVVTFGDGQKFEPKINARFAEGQGSHVIDLPGNRRAIKEVDFVYRSINRREGRGKVLVYAR